MKIKKLIRDFIYNIFKTLVLVSIVGILALGVAIVFSCLGINPIVGIVVISIIGVAKTILDFKKEEKHAK